MWLPPVPAWETAHPIAVHFPIGLLLAAPVLIVLGLILRRQSTGLWIAALVLMGLGTVGAVVAVASGEASEDFAERVAGAAAALERHEELGELARTLFAGLTGGFAVVLAAPLAMKKAPPRRLLVGAHAVFLALYLGAVLVLVNAAHEGGRLVHEYGVRASLSAAPAGAALPPGAGWEHEDD